MACRKEYGVGGKLTVILFKCLQILFGFPFFYSITDLTFLSYNVTFKGTYHVKMMLFEEQSCPFFSEPMYFANFKLMDSSFKSPKAYDSWKFPHRRQTDPKSGAKRK